LNGHTDGHPMCPVSDNRACAFNEYPIAQASAARYPVSCDVPGGLWRRLKA
jgi:hypothetical protein